MTEVVATGPPADDIRLHFSDSHNDFEQQTRQMCVTFSLLFI